MSELKEKGYVVIREYISHEMADYLRFFFIKARENGLTTRTDKMSPEADCYLSAHPFELLLDYKTNFMRKVFGGKRLVPTYSYGRIYYNNATLNSHVDRPSCEVSVSINIGGHYKQPWSFWIENKEIVLDKSDGIIYLGNEKSHWRNPWKGDKDQWQAQLFLHYVDEEGLFKKWKYDGRKNLNY